MQGHWKTERPPPNPIPPKTSALKVPELLSSHDSHHNISTAYFVYLRDMYLLFTSRLCQRRWIAARVSNSELKGCGTDPISGTIPVPAWGTEEMQQQNFGKDSR